MGNIISRWARNYSDGQKIIRMGNIFSRWSIKRCRWAKNFHDGQLNDSDGQVLMILFLWFFETRVKASRSKNRYNIRGFQCINAVFAVTDDGVPCYENFSWNWRSRFFIRQSLAGVWWINYRIRFLWNIWFSLLFLCCLFVS